MNNNFNKKEMDIQLKADLKEIKRQRKANRKFYQKKRFIIPAVFIGLFIMIGNQDTPTPPVENKVVAEVAKVEPEKVATTEVVEPVKVETPKIPTEYKSALRSAENYGKLMHMSKKGIYEQLISEYGDKFTKESAQYAIDNLKMDYKANALISGQNYQDTMAMSPQGVYDQLISEYGEKFTKEEAQYAKDNLK